MAADDEQRDVQVFDGVLDAAESHWVGDIASHPDDEEFAEHLIKDRFWRDARIGIVSTTANGCCLCASMGNSST